METIRATGPNIRAILALVRRAKGWALKDSKELVRSGGGENNWRITLANGAIVECHVKQRSRCSIDVQ